jgi:hypothetical protein
MPLPTGPNWPEVDEYKEWARIGTDVVPDTLDDVAIDQALSAVKVAIVARCPTLAAAPCPEDVLYACLLWTNRLLVRRQSPEGVVGVPDMGMVTIAAFDSDIRQMLSPWLEPVIS